MTPPLLTAISRLTAQSWAQARSCHGTGSGWLGAAAAVQRLWPCWPAGSSQIPQKAYSGAELAGENARKEEEEEEEGVGTGALGSQSLRRWELQLAGRRALDGGGQGSGRAAGEGCGTGPAAQGGPCPPAMEPQNCPGPRKLILGHCVERSSFPTRCLAAGALGQAPGPHPSPTCPVRKASTAHSTQRGQDAWVL